MLSQACLSALEALGWPSGDGLITLHNDAILYTALKPR
jgi:hypothetical protein